MTTAVALAFMLVTPATVIGQGAGGDLFAAMSIERPAQPVAAPDLVFVTAEGREARLGQLRGRSCSLASSA
jgi:hypothetical protein